MDNVEYLKKLFRIYIGVSFYLCCLSVSFGSNTDFTVRGIDVSRYQGKVDFEHVLSTGIVYVFIKATDGVTYVDPNYKKNLQSARKMGISAGVYHYYETNDSPHDQLSHFIREVTLIPGDLPPVVDIERLHKNGDTQLAKNLMIFLDGLKAQYGVTPIIYTGRDFANRYLTDLGGFPLWIAEYDLDKPNLPSAWSDWTFWQWSQKTTIQGVDGFVDADRYNGDEDAFRNLLLK